jgi:hypothetical protein
MNEVFDGGKIYQATRQLMIVTIKEVSSKYLALNDWELHDLYGDGELGWAVLSNAPETSIAMDSPTRLNPGLTMRAKEALRPKIS